MPTLETESPNATGETVAEGQNMTADDTISLFVGKTGKETSEDPEPSEDASPEEGDATEEVKEDEAEEEAAPESVMDRYGLADASQEDLRELAVALGGRLGQELGEQRKANRELQRALETELSKRKPFELKHKGENPYAAVSKIEDLQDTYEAAVQTVKSGKAAIRKHRNAEPDDEILNVGDRSLTFAEVEEMVERAEEARDNYLPERLQQLREAKAFEDRRVELLAEVESIHPWMAEQKSPLRAKVEAVREQFLGKLQTHVPELVPYFDIILADHMASVEARTKGTVKEAPKAKPKVVNGKKPPASPGASAAASGRPVEAKARKAQMLESFTKEGRGMSGADLVQFLSI